MEHSGFNEDGLVYEENYTAVMDGEVLPWLEARRRRESVSAADGKPLSVSRFDADEPRGTVMLVHGFTENAFKFSEIIHSLLRSGWSVVAYDQRGHGWSWRDEKVKDPSLTHVDRFEAYVSDLKTVCDRVLRPMPKPWAVFCHSMGGAVTALFLEKYPDVFERAVFCAPMIACTRGGMPEVVSQGMCAAAKLFGLGRKRLFTSRPYAGAEEFGTSCAGGKARFDWYEAHRIRTPELQNNGPSYSWVLQSLRVTKKILRPGEPEKIRIPVRVYGAEDDNQVLPEQQAEFARRLPNGDRRVIPGSKHEIYRSGDEVFFPWWHEILGFLAGD